MNLMTTSHKNLVDEWDYERNAVDINTVTRKSGRKAHWICSLDNRHRWEAVVAKRTSGQGCPFCSGKRALPGVTSLKALHPDLMKEWDWSRNTDLDPDQLLPGSSKKAHWKCSADPRHMWVTKIHHRTGSGSGCHYCTGQKPLRGQNTLADKKPNLATQWNKSKNDLTPFDVTPSSGERVWWTCPKNAEHTWDAVVYSRKSPDDGYPKCNPKSSKAETELAEFVEEFTEIQRNVRDLIRPYEVDILVPKKKIAIEFNGVFWHSQAGTGDKNSHRNKVRMCSEEGVQLITIWEDDWIYRKDIVKRMLKHKLGYSDEPKTYARKTYVDSEISTVEAHNFQKKNHIQGAGFGSLKIGLRDEKGTLVALGVFKKRTKTTLELVRYCTSHHVIGGQSKILSWIDLNVEYTEMITFADLSLSTGDLYEKTGWTLDGELPPDYMYVVGDQRKHKYGYRIKRFKEDPKLKYEEEYSETQLAQLNGLRRIYDCGKLRYIRMNPELV